MSGRVDGVARFALQLAPRQARLVAEALGLRPYGQVQALMARLEAWARDWTDGIDTRGGAAPFVLDAGELALVVSALSDLPYRRVHTLVRGLEAQLAALPQGAARTALEGTA
ncbi:MULTISPECIES: hypothetical protein [Massilia]|uniref:Uncharacterized protein n=1 Tax=Massilia aurea TaxID=373040 RepID=A0A422QI65_9BURK|nr:MULTISPECIES: hypothetical protein [Massilia]MDY0961167.1 hypothetical protein [Massilia sp. CFBP9026]RNF29657.1 hypothetical protein NM04_16775 [Massilia aurea]